MPGRCPARSPGQSRLRDRWIGPDQATRPRSAGPRWTGPRQAGHRPGMAPLCPRGEGLQGCWIQLVLPRSRREQRAASPHPLPSSRTLPPRSATEKCQGSAEALVSSWWVGAAAKMQLRINLAPQLQTGQHGDVLQNPSLEEAPAGGCGSGLRSAGRASSPDGDSSGAVGLDGRRMAEQVAWTRTAVGLRVGIERH